ncbi:uncharacterized protein LOC111708492 [Eurytemora carolleeae]|uniref:uncharacterized protein LOC111708492 n=1 Tax=Eurytemora carolleeae TaxID=1294199 RepID=UPI000C761E01|nr:uncharacterized protein LOC111708492 [Eurytemora carolleeae]|eukprot:XP_023337659.1 uncharacterized protein LOC111708492 [Eurytemora affinis]
MLRILDCYIAVVFPFFHQVYLTQENALSSSVVSWFFSLFTSSLFYFAGLTKCKGCHLESYFFFIQTNAFKFGMVLPYLICLLTATYFSLHVIVVVVGKHKQIKQIVPLELQVSGNHEEEDGTAANPPCHHSDSTPPSQSTVASFPIPSTSHPNPVSFPTPASISTSFHTAPSCQSSSSFPAPMTVPNVRSIRSTLPSPSRAPSTSTMTSFDKPVYYIMRYDKAFRLGNPSCANNNGAVDFTDLEAVEAGQPASNFRLSDETLISVPVTLPVQIQPQRQRPPRPPVQFLRRHHSQATREYCLLCCF